MQTFVLIHGGVALGYGVYNNLVSDGDYVVVDGGVRLVHSRNQLFGDNPGFGGVLIVGKDLRTAEDKRVTVENSES